MDVRIEEIISTLHVLNDKIDKSNAEIRKISRRLDEVEAHNKVSKDTVEYLRSRITTLENQTRRNNLIFYGIPEEPNETWERCETKLIQIIRDTLNINLNCMSIERAQRLGKRTNLQRPRPMIAKFAHFKTKQEILKKSGRFRNAGYSLAEHFSKEVYEERLFLHPLVNAAKRLGYNSYLSFNCMKINGRKFSKADIEAAQKDTSGSRREIISKIMRPFHEAIARERALHSDESADEAVAAPSRRRHRMYYGRQTRSRRQK